MAKRRQKKDIYLMPEPNWAEINTLESEEDKLKLYRKFEYFVHYEVADKKADATVHKWLDKDSGLDKDLIKKLKKVPDVWFRSFAKHTFIWTKTNGYMHDKIRQHLIDKIPKLEEKAEEIIEVKQAKAADAKPKISIQERMRQQVEGLCADWEAMLDTMIYDTGFNLKKFDPYTDMRAYAGGIIKPNHAKIIKEDFEPQYLEAVESLEGTCEQLKEAYSFMDKKMKKDYVGFYEKINQACDTMIQTGKAQRKPRKPKAVSREKLVSKLKFQVNESSLGIASINPTDIIDAKEVWVYNTKTRKVGVYYVEELKTGLTVKGTTLQDFNTVKSVQKTLRKPAEQIKNWTGTSKTKYAKAFKELTTTDTRMNGRFNENTIILKAF